MTAPYPPPSAAPSNDRTTLFGVLGIVFSICCPIVGVIFAALSLNAAKKSGKSPTLAYIGFAIAIISIIGGIVYQTSR
ncbi:hypothetical protein WEI85_11000 [Actinomycetes bacterium KLBMP 9797]